MKYIVGKKLKMTQIFKDSGEVVPVTLVEAGPCTVTQIRTKDKDGYEAVQVGFFPKKKVNKPKAGHLKGLENFSYLSEYRAKPKEDISSFKRGDKIDVSSFKEGDKVMVVATSKAKGFQGVVKRHGFHGGSASHGQKHSLREAGSIGPTWPQRVLLCRRMAGRMGGVTIAVKNLKVSYIDQEKNILAIKGAIPGIPGAIVEIYGK
jgi:large subunit ribosomal protein L3